MPRSRRTTAALVVAATCLATLAAVTYYVWCVPEWHGQVTVDTKLWPELDLVNSNYDRSQSDHEQTLVRKGTIVVVMRTRYGKDFMACDIRTDDGVQGWVLCTDLERLRRDA